MLARALLLFIAMLGLAASAGAHEIRPAFLQIREIEPSTLSIENAAGHGPAAFGVEHVREFFGSRAVYDQLFAVAVVRDAILLQRVLCERRERHGDESIELCVRSRMPRIAAGSHYFAGADIEAGARRGRGRAPTRCCLVV